MSRLINRILDNTPRDYFSDTEVKTWFPGSPASRYNLISRAIAHEDITLIRKGLYVLHKRYQRQGLNLYELAQQAYGPSYLSFESALSYHGLIPEAVYSVTNATFKRSCSFKTPFGLFTYTTIPKAVFFSAVRRICLNHQPILVASPVKALADTIYSKHLDWVDTKPLIESLRIDEDNLKYLDIGEIEDLRITHPSSRVRKFLAGLQKDLKS